MQDEEILKKAIEKAVKNGWEDGNNYLCFWKEKDILESKKVDFKEAREILCYPTIQHIIVNELFNIIFSHAFAKAFWGEGHQEFGYGDDKGICRTIDGWKQHLQKMVLEEQPLQYITRFLNERQP